MADSKFTGVSPAFLLFVPIRPAIVRGRLVYTVADVAAFTSPRLAMCAWSAAQAHRLDIAEQLHELTARRTVALAGMRSAGDDFAAFSLASKEEAELARQIRHLRTGVSS